MQEVPSLKMLLVLSSMKLDEVCKVGCKEIDPSSMDTQRYLIKIV